MRRALLSLNHIAGGALLVVVTSVTAQPAPPQQQELPWPAKLGLRSHAVAQAFPLIDRVVLVPDAATYIDELKKWSPAGRWPVLIEDDVLTPMFVRRFSPAQLVRRESVNIAGEFKPNAEELNAIIVQAFGGNPEQHTVKDVFAAQQFAPPGVVLASLNDSAWTAAIALAAGRGQPIAWLNGSYGSPNDELDADTTQRLIAAVDAAIEAQGYSYRSLGDDIDTITICREIACRARPQLSPEVRTTVGGPHGDGPIALTDLLGRNADGTRYAIAGWIFGDEKRAAYMAMCSLFLSRERAMLFNTYPQGNPWDQYSLTAAATTLAQAGFAVQHTSGAAADERGWLRMLTGGVTTDVYAVNTKGNADFFDLISGSCSPLDVPILNEPAAVHFIHSWSMQFPARLDTVGGQWLDRGAYAAVGSCWEPYLMAFLPPSELTKRWVSFVPFLVAARWWDNQSPLSKPWRVVTIGDPLMLCASPQQVAIQRRQPNAHDGLDLNAHVKQLMRQTQDDTTGEIFDESIRLLSMLGRDDIASEVWRLANAEGELIASRCARSAMEPLFRRRDFDEFNAAWSALPSRDARASDMLWHLMSARLGAAGVMDADVVAQLQSAIRQPFPQFDVRRLAPQVERMFGKPGVQQMIRRELQRTNSAGAQRALTELSDQY